MNKNVILYYIIMKRAITQQETEEHGFLRNDSIHSMPRRGGNIFDNILNGVQKVAQTAGTVGKAALPLAPLLLGLGSHISRVEQHLGLEDMTPEEIEHYDQVENSNGLTEAIHAHGSGILSGLVGAFGLGDKVNGGNSNVRGGGVISGLLGAVGLGDEIHVPARDILSGNEGGDYVVGGNYPIAGNYDVAGNYPVAGSYAIGGRTLQGGEYKIAGNSRIGGTSTLDNFRNNNYNVGPGGGGGNDMQYNVRGGNAQRRMNVNDLIQ